MNPSNPFGNLQGFLANPFTSKIRHWFGLILPSGYLFRVFNSASLIDNLAWVHIMNVEFAHDPRETRFKKGWWLVFSRAIEKFSSDVGMVLAFFRSLNCTAAGKKCNYLLFFLCLFFKNNYLEVFTTIDFQEKTLF